MWHSPVTLAACGSNKTRVCFAGEQADGGGFFGSADSSGAQASSASWRSLAAAPVADALRIVTLSAGVARYQDFTPDGGLATTTTLSSAAATSLASKARLFATAYEKPGGATGFQLLAQDDTTTNWASSTFETAAGVESSGIVDLCYSGGEVFQLHPSTVPGETLAVSTCFSGTYPRVDRISMGVVSAGYDLTAYTLEHSATQLAFSPTSVFVATEHTVNGVRVYRFAPGDYNATTSQSVTSDSNVRLVAAGDSAVFLATSINSTAKLRRLRYASASITVDSAVISFPDLEIAALAVFQDPAHGPSLALFGLCRASSSICARNGLGVVGVMPIGP